MGKKRSANTLVEEQVDVWCFYCDRQFHDEKNLLIHQQSKHFKCDICNKKLSGSRGLVAHVSQVHKEIVKSIPAAKEGRDSVDFDVYGMLGIPAQFLDEHTRAKRQLTGEEEAGDDEGDTEAGGHMGPTLTEHSAFPVMASVGYPSSSAYIPYAPTLGSYPPSTVYPPQPYLHHTPLPPRPAPLSSSGVYGISPLISPLPPPPPPPPPVLMHQTVGPPPPRPPFVATSSLPGIVPPPPAPPALSSLPPIPMPPPVFSLPLANPAAPRPPILVPPPPTMPPASILSTAYNSTTIASTSNATTSGSSSAAAAKAEPIITAVPVVHKAPGEAVLVWTDEEFSMEERRAQLAKYSVRHKSTAITS